MVVEKSSVVIVATKPPLGIKDGLLYLNGRKRIIIINVSNLVPKVLLEINPVVSSNNLIISIAMGIPLSALEQVQYYK